MTLKELPHLRSLPVREKLELVEDLWLDVAGELDELAVTTEEKQLLDERWATFAENPDKALTPRQGPHLRGVYGKARSFGKGERGQTEGGKGSNAKYKDQPLLTRLLT